MDERLNRRAVLVLLVLAWVLAYMTFQWGGWCQPLGINTF
jgi:hypothetical protein